MRYAAGVLLIAVGYYTAAQGGEALLLTGPAGAFWPATGVGIAVLYLGGLRWWPGVLLGDLLSREFTLLPLETALAETAGNMARALLAVVILQRLVGRRAAMDRLEHVGAVFAAVAVGEAVSATVAMLALRAGDVIETSEMGVFWRSWWLGGLAGGLVVVPLAMAWAHTRVSVWRGRRAVEGAMTLAAVAGLSVIALSADQPLTYIVFPAFIWAALRLGPPGATLAVAVAAVIAVLATSNAEGPFVEHSPTDSALNLQLYIVFAALTTGCLAAIVSERRRAALELAESQRREGERAALERQRIARDLHDSVSQSLFSTTLHVRTAQHALELEKLDSTGPVGEELNEIGQLTRGRWPRCAPSSSSYVPARSPRRGWSPRWPSRRRPSAPGKGWSSRSTDPMRSCPSDRRPKSSSTASVRKPWPTWSSTPGRAPPRSASPRRTTPSRSRCLTTAAASTRPPWVPSISACGRCEAGSPISEAASRSRARPAAAPSFASWSRPPR